MFDQSYIFSANEIIYFKWQDKTRRDNKTRGNVVFTAGFRFRSSTNHQLDCDFKITAVPITISYPGTWCFDKDLTYSGSGNGPIDIKASNVTLDLNSHILRGPMDGGKVVPGYGYLTGVNVSGVCCTTDPTLKYNNIKIRNGTISGFHYGILMYGNQSASGHVIENMQIRDIASSAISFNGVKTPSFAIQLFHVWMRVCVVLQMGVVIPPLSTV